MPTNETSITKSHSFLKDLGLTINCFCCVPMYSMALSMTCFWTMIYYAPSVWWRTALLAYLPYCVLDRRPRAGRSGVAYRWTEYCRSVPFYAAVAAYFPVHLHKTKDLDPSKPYIFLYHPHGVISMGANTALMTNGCQFDQVFPGVRRHGVTLNVSFWAPLFREWMLWLGYISANRETLQARLALGTSVVLVPGGAAEALHAHPSNFRLHIRHRKGFIRLAMEASASPIPCLGLGENEAFETLYEGGRQSLLWHWQQRLCKLLSFSLPILTSILPNRKPIHVVVGEPVVFQGTTVDECHAEYMEAVRQLYNEHRSKYGYEKLDIEFV